MIRYWITGVLVELGPNGEMELSDVAWTGHMTKKMVPFGIDMTREITMISGDRAYGYTSLRHANEALVRVVRRGKGGYQALRNVQSIKVRVVEYHSNGNLYLLSGDLQ